MFDDSDSVYIFNLSNSCEIKNTVTPPMKTTI